MNLHLPFFNLDSMKTRAIFAGAGAASFYGWLQYTSPDALLGLLDTNSIMADPLNPMIIIPPLAAAGVLLPKFIKMPGRIGLPKFKQNGVSNNQYVESGATLLEFGKNQDIKGPNTNSIPFQMVSASSTSSSSAATTATGSPGQSKDASPPSQQPAVAANQTGTTTPVQVDESKLSAIVESKTSKMVEEVETIKKEMGSIVQDVQSLKTDIKELTSTFESSLVELKAFQSEMVNPVNFMRKYFELLDIKNVSDPVNVMMPIEQLVNNIGGASDTKHGGNAATAATTTEPGVRTKGNNIKNQQQDGDVKIIESQNTGSDKTTSSKTRAQTDEAFSIEEIYNILRQHRAEGFEEDDDGAEEDNDDEQYSNRKYRRTQAHRSHFSSLARSKIKNRNLMSKRSMIGSENEEFLGSSLESSLTPGRIMSIVSIVDEILASMGPDGIELVLEQYRAIGLRPEEERLIYGVVKMLNESKLLTDDIIAMLYRFGQVLGINDQDAELQYMKIVANKRNKKKRIARGMMPREDEE
ncbi:hypothetical protein [Candidatus Nitrososphaera gargensis]|nr:hypothetical protein [Candidatus Nitrososphaera gargensis]